MLGHQAQHGLVDALVLGRRPDHVDVQVAVAHMAEQDQLDPGAVSATTWRTAASNSARRDWGKRHVELVRHPEGGDGFGVALPVGPQAGPGRRRRSPRPWPPRAGPARPAPRTTSRSDPAPRRTPRPGRRGTPGRAGRAGRRGRAPGSGRRRRTARPPPAPPPAAAARRGAPAPRRCRPRRAAPPPSPAGRPPGADRTAVTIPSVPSEPTSSCERS